MASQLPILTLNHAEWATFVHAALERERQRLTLLAAENRLTAAQSHWWTTPAELGEAAAHYAQLCAEA